MAHPIGGLASGIDTLGLLDGLMDAARAPLNKLENQRSLLEIKKAIFNDVNDQLYDLKAALLELKLETTFKSKNVTSSDDTIVTGTATTAAAPGAHTINISQLATSASARSLYTNSVLVPNPANTAGVTTVFGRSAENTEGRYAITIADAGSYYTATAVFTPDVGGTMRTVSGATTGVESSTLQGTIANSVSASDTLNLTVGSDSITISLAATTADATMMSEVAADIMDKINIALNTARNTIDITYVVSRTTGNTGTANNDGFVLYSMNNEAITVTGGTGTVQADLGFSSVTQSTAQTISNTVYADNLNALLGKMNDDVRGMIRGVSFTESATGLSTGTLRVDVSSELNVLGGTPTYVYGGLDVATGASLNTTVVGINNSGFSTTITGVTNTSTGITSGTFTINGIAIEITNIDAVSVNDVIGMINSSAAGVTASYDSTTDSFTLQSNIDGSFSISLGEADDTTNILTAAKISYAMGATRVYGNTKGSVSRSATLTSAGFGRTPTSGTFTINGTTLYVDVSSDSIESLIAKINYSDAGVLAAYDTTTDKFTLSSNQNDVDTNTNQITIGAITDSSNILNILNLQGDFYTTLSGTVISGNRATDDILIAPPTGLAVTLSTTATTGSGAYQTTAGTVNWIDGIKDGGTISVLAGVAGATAYTWTNNSGAVIADIDTFVSEWNDTTNWSGTTVEVKVIKEGANQIRFFSNSQGAGAEFTLTAHSAYDLYELGLITSVASEISATANSPEGVWHFNEGTGTSAADATTNSNDGTISGATWTEGDFFSRSLDFDGTDDYVEVTGSASLNLNTATNFTVEAWVKPDTYGGGTARILSKTGVEIYIDSATKAVFVYVNGSTVAATVQSTAGSLPTTFTDEWYHIAVTYDDGQAVGSKTKIYINGTDVTNGATDTVNGAITDDLVNTYIGNDTAGAGNAFDGQIDEVAFNSGYTKNAGEVQTSALTTLRTVTVTTGDQATASAQYNALSLAYDINSTPSAGIWATTGVINTTDSTVSTTLTSGTIGYYGNFGLADEDVTTPAVSTVSDYFGADPVTSTFAEDTAIGTSGEDAYFSVDNVNYIRTSNSVDDVIGGVTLKLGNSSVSNAILNIEVDTDRGVDKLTNFVVVYNRTLEMLNPPQLTDFQRGYLEPLADDEKDSMTESEIDLYEAMHDKYHGTKALQSEGSFRRIYEYFRMYITADVTGLPDTFNSITDINIVPGLVGTDDDARKGYLISGPIAGDAYTDYIKDALENNYALIGYLANNSDDIYNLFSNDSSASGGSDGIANLLSGKIDSYVLTNGILKEQIKTAGSIDDDILLIDKQILRWNIRLEDKEEYYWTKFLKMEEAIQKLTMQSQNLAGLLENLRAQSRS